MPFLKQVIDRKAHFSPDRIYRYWLYRGWEPATMGETVVWIGMNPSVADAEKDDRTIRRCIDFSQRLGYAAMYMVNLFAKVSTKVHRLWTGEHPVGKDNDLVIHSLARNAGLVIACWGTFENADERRIEFLSQVDYPLHCLGVTMGGHPKHPLYLKKNTVLMPFNVIKRKGVPHLRVRQAARLPKKIVLPG